MNGNRKTARGIAAGAMIICTLFSVVLTSLISGTSFPSIITAKTPATSKASDDSEKPIRWVDFDVPYEVLKKAMDTDIETYGTEHHINWIDILAYLAAKYGGNFNCYENADMEAFVSAVKSGTSVEEITDKMNYFDYYRQAYGAILGGFLGEFTTTLYESDMERADSQPPETAEVTYGLKAFSPIAEGFYYSEFDDFGTNRSYGYSRRHLGHDMMTSIGTPVVAVESGTVEALGWNQYGGWRIGIRSHDNLRYYYYAHLQKNHPYTENMSIGADVSAGDVIGYTGMTGYSIKENVNNIDTPHLHYGLQLVFDEDAKDSPTQIWIDLYDITRLLSTHRCTVVKNEHTGEYQRKYILEER